MIAERVSSVNELVSVVDVDQGPAYVSIGLASSNLMRKCKISSQKAQHNDPTILTRSQFSPDFVGRGRLRFKHVIPRCLIVAQYNNRYLLVGCQGGPELDR